MSVTDRKVYRFAAFGREYIQFYVASVPINQAGVTFGLVTPYQGYPIAPWGSYGWYVENIQGFCTALVAGASYTILILPSGQNLVQNSLSTPIAGAVQPPAGNSICTTNTSLRRGKLTDQLSFRCTTDGTGTMTNLLVTLTLRPYPLDGEAA